MNIDELFREVFCNGPIPPREGASVPELIKNMEHNIKIKEGRKQ